MKDLEKMVKMSVFGPKWPFLDRFWPKMAEKRFFRQKAKMSLFNVFIEPGLHEKNQNKPTMPGSLGNVRKTECQKVQEMLILVILT